MLLFDIRVLNTPKRSYKLHIPLGKRCHAAVCAVILCAQVVSREQQQLPVPWPENCDTLPELELVQTCRAETEERAFPHFWAEPMLHFPLASQERQCSEPPRPSSLSLRYFNWQVCSAASVLPWAPWTARAAGVSQRNPIRSRHGKDEPPKEQQGRS